jgi:hypothetical protein
MNQLDLGTSTEDDCISIRAYAQWKSDCQARGK